jgi:hypothetical protein
MHPEQSTSAPGAQALPAAIDQRTTEYIQIAVLALKLRISEHI